MGGLGLEDVLDIWWSLRELGISCRYRDAAGPCHSGIDWDVAQGNSEQGS